MRVLLAIDTDQQATFFEQYLADAGHEIVAVEARGDLALKAARLVHPDVVIINGPLRGPIDSSGLTAALKANREAPVPVLFVTDPAELPALLEQQAYYLSSPTPDAASNAA